MLTLLSNSNLVYAAVTYAAILAIGTICHNSRYQYAMAYCKTQFNRR